MTISSMNTLIKLDDITNDYQYLNDEETTLVIDHIKDHIDHVKYKPNMDQWNSAWGDIGDCDAPSYLKPRFTIDDQGVYRYNQKFIKSPYPNLESKFHDELLKRVQNMWLSDIDCVVEFGCGTGHNLQKIRHRDSFIKVYGSDWANSSQEILQNHNIPCWNFDMKTCLTDLPKEILEFNNVCFLTVGSLEQLGGEWEKFLDFMLEFKPKRSIHIEPIEEFYDKNNKIDALAYQYHKTRGYLTGFFNHIINLDQLKFYSRVLFGNTYNEGFNILELEYE